MVPKAKKPTLPKLTTSPTRTETSNRDRDRPATTRRWSLVPARRRVGGYRRLWALHFAAAAARLRRLLLLLLLSPLYRQLKLKLKPWFKRRRRRRRRRRREEEEVSFYIYQRISNFNVRLYWLGEIKHGADAVDLRVELPVSVSLIRRGTVLSDEGEGEGAGMLPAAAMAAGCFCRCYCCVLLFAPNPRVRSLHRDHFASSAPSPGFLRSKAFL